MTFNSYAQYNGYKPGDYIPPGTAQRLYDEYQTGGGLSLQPAQTVNPGMFVNRQPQQQQPAQSQGLGGGMGNMAGGIAGGMLKGQAGGASTGGAQGNAGAFSGSWAGVPGGAISGAMAGHQAAKNDPDMSNGKDGFGKHYRDSRAEVGGAVLGGVMGYYGLGAMAGPAVTAAHPVMEPTTRWLINTGDKFGGAGGALMMDPIGTVASGKYSAGDLAKGALLGPLSKYV